MDDKPLSRTQRRYYKCKAEGRCVACGGPSRPDRTTCQVCIDKQVVRARVYAEYKRQWYLAHRDEISEQARLRYLQHRSERIAQVKRNSQRCRERERAGILDAYGHACACCGESEPRLLALDHINGGGGAERKALKKWGWNFYAVLRKQGYPEGFQILCFSCNAAKSIYGRCPHQE